jgi:hypothetical protein
MIFLTKNNPRFHFGHWTWQTRNVTETARNITKGKIEVGLRGARPSFGGTYLYMMYVTYDVFGPSNI